MKLSIVVPTYNQGPYIRDCLESIREQTYKDIEIIIQDAFSTDKTEAICREYSSRDPRFIYFREADNGQSDAINRGLRRSTGEIWTWICSDDYYLDRQALEKLVTRLSEGISQDQMCVGVYGDAEFVSGTKRRLGRYTQFHRDLDHTDFKEAWPLSQPSSLLVRKFVEEAGGVQTDLHLGMDLDLFIKVLKNGRKLLYVPYPVAAVRVQPESKSVKYRKATAENALQIIKEHFGSIGNPFRSVYLREYGAAESIELKQKIKAFLRPIKPLFVRAPAVVLPGPAGTMTSASEANIDETDEPKVRRTPLWLVAHYSGLHTLVMFLFFSTTSWYFRLRRLKREF